MLRKWYCQADITIRITPVDPLLIKSGYATFSGPDMTPVQTKRNGRDVYYLPGTSLKGVFRSHLERIGRTLKDGVICVPYYDGDKADDRHLPPVASEQKSYGCSFRLQEVPTTAECYRRSCPVCRLFGSLKFGGRAGFSDALPLEGQEPQVELRNGVCIDRFTGGVAQGPFEMTVLVGGTFETVLRLTNFELWQLAAIHLLFQDLADEMISIGSGQSRGLGRIRGTVYKYELSYLVPPPQLCGLAQLVSPEERTAYGLHSSSHMLPTLPEGKRVGLRTVYDASGCWQTWTEALTPAFADFLEWYRGQQGPLGN